MKRVIDIGAKISTHLRSNYSSKNDCVFLKRICTNTFDSISWKYKDGNIINDVEKNDVFLELFVHSRNDKF